MGKGSSILAIIALIFGLGATGYILYENFIAIPDSPTPENEWFDSTSSSWYMASSEAWSIMLAVNIDFSVHAGQNVYHSLICGINFDDSSDPSSYIEIRLLVDGYITSPWIYVRRYNIVSPNGLSISASLQHYNSTMLPGNHNVTVIYKGDSTADYIAYCSLFTQTYN